MKTDGIIRSTVLLFFLLSVCAGCGNDSTAARKILQDKKPVQEPLPSGNRTVAVTLMAVPEQVTGMGTAQAFRRVAVSPEISGKVAALHGDVGMRAEKGDMLIELEREARQITLQKQQALLEKARATHKKLARDKKKAEALFKDGIMSDTEYDGIRLDRQLAEADLELAEANVAAARKDLKDTRIRAPFSGSIARRSTELGDFVTPGKELLTLVDIAAVKIVIHVSELDVPGITPGCSASVRIDSLPGTTFSGTVHSIGLTADDTTRCYPVEIIAQNPGGSILPGMVARVAITATGSKNVLTVPRAAVTRRNGIMTVTVIEGNTTVEREIVMGAVREGMAIISEGLTENDTVVLPRES